VPWSVHMRAGTGTTRIRVGSGRVRVTGCVGLGSQNWRTGTALLDT